MTAYRAATRESLVPRMRAMARRGIYDGRPTPANRHLLARCTWRYEPANATPGGDVVHDSDCFLSADWPEIAEPIWRGQPLKVSLALEQVINRRLFNNRLDGYLQETGRELATVARAALSSAPSAPEGRALSDLRSVVVALRDEQDREYAACDPNAHTLTRESASAKGDAYETVIAAIDAISTQPSAPEGKYKSALEKARETIDGMLYWAQHRCPCTDEKPDPCTLCGVSVASLEGCKAVDASFPRSSIVAMNEALAAIDEALQSGKDTGAGK